MITRGMADLTREAQVRAQAGVDGHGDTATYLDLRAGQETNFNAGVGGMHEFVDDKATTRGDH